VRLWLKVHREVAGAWRSACYDMCRQIERRRLDRLGSAETAEFGPRHHKGLHIARRSNRLVATTGVALLVAGGAAGTYLAVAGGLAALTAEPFQPPVAAPAQPFAGAPAPAPAASTRTAAPAATRPRPQVRRSSAPPVLALPEVPAPVEQPTTGTTEQESTATPSASPSASVTASPSPSVDDPWPTRRGSKRPKWGRHRDEEAASRQSDAGR
jgi:hypothetical protein